MQSTPPPKRTVAKVSGSEPVIRKRVAIAAPPPNELDSRAMATPCHSLGARSFIEPTCPSAPPNQLPGRYLFRYFRIVELGHALEHDLARALGISAVLIRFAIFGH